MNLIDYEKNFGGEFFCAVALSRSRASIDCGGSTAVTVTNPRQLDQP
jgi:hypothetical protein